MTVVKERAAVKVAHMLSEALTSKGLHDKTYTYDVINLLMDFSKPFSEWDAYRLGLISYDGALQRKPRTVVEKNALPPLMVLLLKLKAGLIPTEKSIKWQNYFTSYKEVFMTNMKESLDVLFSEEGEGGPSPASTGATTNTSAVGGAYEAPFTKKKKKKHKVLKRSRKQMKELTATRLDTIKEFYSKDYEFLYIVEEETNNTTKYKLGK